MRIITSFLIIAMVWFGAAVFIVQAGAQIDSVYEQRAAEITAKLMEVLL